MNRNDRNRSQGLSIVSALPQMMAPGTVPECDRVEKLAVAMADCLVELDLIEAHTAAVHLESALQALHRHAPTLGKVSTPD